MPGTQDINIHYICTPKERIDDLSMSLFGIYNAQHINLKLTANGNLVYNHYCEPDEDVPTPVPDRDFTNDGARGFWCAPVSKLAEIPFAYTRGNDQLTVICKVVHTPVKWNFWHHSLRWVTDAGPLEEIEDKNKRENVARRIGHSARAAISHFAKYKVPESPLLPRTCYCKN